jgi:hypothetical protein
MTEIYQSSAASRLANQLQAGKSVQTGYGVYSASHAMDTMPPMCSGEESVTILFYTVASLKQSAVLSPLFHIS